MFYGVSLSLISLRYILLSYDSPKVCYLCLGWAEGCWLGRLFEINHFYHMAVWHHGRQTGVLVEQLTTTTPHHHMSPYEYFLAGYWDRASVSQQACDQCASHNIP